MNAANRDNQRAAIRHNLEAQAKRNNEEFMRKKEERQQHQEMIEMEKRSSELKA